MDQNFEDRLRRVIERHADARKVVQIDTSPFHKRHLAREHVLAAIPVAFQRLAATVGEINDALEEVGVRLLLKAADELLSLEASFIVSVWPAYDPPAELHFNVNLDGRMTALLVVDASPSALDSKEVWCVDRQFFQKALVSLLEV